MNKVFIFFKLVWFWLYDRTPLWIVLGFFGLMSLGIVKKSDIATKAKQEELNCRLECIPNSSELFANQCWCYYDNKTLIKVDKRP